MPFVFRLERVLSVRRIQEELARERNVRAQESLVRARSVLETLCLRLTSSLEDLDRLKHCDELSPEALYLHSLHVAGLRRQIEGARTRAAKAASEAERVKAELVQAYQAREALDRLREREETLWRRNQMQKEARSLDEIAISRHRAREEENHGP